MLVIRRKKNYKDSLRSFKIYLDGNLIGKIKNGSTLSFDISEGPHVLKLKIDWCSSNEIEFNYSYKDDVSFICAVSKESNIINKYSIKNDYLILEMVDHL